MRRRVPPTSPQLWFLLGYAARLANKGSLSVEAYSHGLRLNPSSLDGLSGLAQSYRMIGKTDEAEALLKRVVAADPKRIDDEISLAELYIKSGDYAVALPWLNRAEQTQPGTRSELLLAITYQRLKQLDQANHYLELAKSRAPENSEVERALAGYYLETGSYAEAITALEGDPQPKAGHQGGAGVCLPAERQSDRVCAGSIPRPPTRRPKTWGYSFLRRRPT